MERDAAVGCIRNSSCPCASETPARSSSTVSDPDVEHLQQREYMRALVLNCTLKRNPEPSATEALAAILVEELANHSVRTEVVRLADLQIKSGVQSHMGPGDEWPIVRTKILRSEILIIATPAGVGQPSSMVPRLVERMDAMLNETNTEGVPVAYGRVAGILMSSDQDSAHHVGALSQALIDIGFTVPGRALTYWHLVKSPQPNHLCSKIDCYSDELARSTARNLLTVADALARTKFSHSGALDKPALTPLKHMTSNMRSLAGNDGSELAQTKHHVSEHRLTARKRA